MIGRQLAIKIMKKRCATNHHANSFQLKEKMDVAQEKREVDTSKQILILKVSMLDDTRILNNDR